MTGYMTCASAAYPAFVANNKLELVNGKLIVVPHIFHTFQSLSDRQKRLLPIPFSTCRCQKVRLVINEDWRGKDERASLGVWRLSHYTIRACLLEVHTSHCATTLNVCAKYTSVVFVKFGRVFLGRKMRYAWKKPIA